MARGGWLAAAAFGMAALAPAAEAGAATEEGRMRFAVHYDGDRIGMHELRFTRLGPDSLRVEIAIDLKVGFAFVTLFRYTHRNETQWEQGELVRMSARTNDDGTKHRVQAERTDEGQLRVTDENGTTRTMPGDTLPSTYWMTATVERAQLLNTQKGNLAEITVAQHPKTDLVPTPEGRVPAQGYTMSGGLDAKAWYDEQGRWVKLTFQARGSTVRYELIERSGFVPTSPKLDSKS
ncbi:hypothetical protein SAMN05216241_11432 [Limimonas halophila]|uniref:DUF3108 domain-containing protein n=1 Tax=Limimonas halophila TaxID=1082479 RepID=A0A1G7UGH7_9PROT|nr:DUF6134 family protein [Limimonas halophila]SDG46675.1 hypothetical protein SAMN05216241_11432 [Limimonas halophila]